MSIRGPIDPERLEEYLRSTRNPGARVEALEPLGGIDQDVKAYGYGQPVLARYTVGDRTHEIVVRTTSPDPFGHDRRADRVGALVLDFDTFGTMPRHIEASDVGVLDSDGSFVSLPPGEPFLITDYVEGRLYAADLREQAGSDRPDPRALDRARALARYLVELHRDPRDPDTYTRDLRDTIGHGEGIFGLADSYPPDDPVVPSSRLEALEVAAVRHRWRLAPRSERARRTHGDFHPFNILFREGTDFTVLDCSRGGSGEPADDVTCLSINYLFFALLERGSFTGALRELWDEFWDTYLGKSQDRRLLEAAPLYFAWRALVLASPVWYPEVEATARERLLSFVETLLAEGGFDPREPPGV